MTLYMLLKIVSLNTIKYIPLFYLFLFVSVRFVVVVVILMRINKAKNLLTKKSMSKQMNFGTYHRRTSCLNTTELTSILDNAAKAGKSAPVSWGHLSPPNIPTPQSTHRLLCKDGD